MRRGPTLGRRRILGMGLAAAIGAGAGFLGRIVPRRALRWERRRAFPDATVALEVRLPESWTGQGQVVLILEEPGGSRTLPGGQVEIVDGRGTGGLCLTYPHPGRVPGRYRYHAELRIGGRTWRTGSPVTYSLGKAAWFS